MSHSNTGRPTSGRRPSLAVVLIACVTAALLWVPILALSPAPIWFW